ncbi:MAG: hypothetical protein AAF526_07655 [Pseudomonadota bacterium]
MNAELPLTLNAVHEVYENGASPSDIVREVYRRIEAVGDDAIFIHLRPMAEVLAEAS